MTPEMHHLIDAAFGQTVEARKRCEYVRQALGRGDTFGAGEDVALALAELGDATLNLAHLQGLVDGSIEPTRPGEPEPIEGEPTALAAWQFVPAFAADEEE